MKPRRILIADDHALVRAGMAHVLTDVEGIELVGEVADGPSLFRNLDSLQPDCLLVDLRMPDFEPVTAIRRIREQYPGLKVLVVSAHSDASYVQEFFRVGVDGFYLKTESLADLRLAVARVLDGQRWISSALIPTLLEARAGAAVTPNLTSRQRSLLGLLKKGLDNRAIARELDLSVKTVENDLTRLYRRIGVQSRVEAVNFATEHPDLQQPPPTPVPYPSRPVAVDAAKRDLTVLLVDDNARFRKQLRQIIANVYAKAILYETDSMADAVHLARRINPQLVFIDVILGEEDGIECARRITASHTTTRVILISAYPDREFRRLGLEAGASAFIDKADLQASSVRQIVDDVLN